MYTKTDALPKLCDGTYLAADDLITHRRAHQLRIVVQSPAFYTLNVA